MGKQTDAKVVAVNRDIIIAVWYWTGHNRSLHGYYSITPGRGIWVKEIKVECFDSLEQNSRRTPMEANYCLEITALRKSHKQGMQG